MVDAPKWVERWEKQRARGALRFIFSMGIPYGLAMFFAVTFAGRSSHPLTSRSLLVNAVAWAVGGLLFGAALWWISEWRYYRYRRLTNAGGVRETQ